MWIVRIALDRPYTFIVLAVLILVLSPIMILRTPTDIFPNINIPVIAVAWQFTGMNPEELEGRLTGPFERVLTTTVDNIEHIESTTVSGQAIIRIYLQPGASLDTANAQVTAISQTAIRQLPPGILPPLIINYSASSVPILQLGLSGTGLSEQQLNDLGQNFLRPQLVTVPGAVVPFLYGGKQRQVMVDLNPGLMQSKGLAPQDVLTAVQQQNLILPSGTAKMGPFEYDVRLNASLKSVPELNDLPVKVVGNSTIYLRDVANVRDAFAPQTNVVRQDGHRGALVSILKAGNASIIAVSIPLSILTSVMILSFLGETINIMTLGGLALAVGILVDDATVTIENIERYFEEGHAQRDAILEGAAQIAVPALVSTLCICIVFLPMFLLSGVARYLFVPLAEAVVFAMLASYILSRTLVPTLAMYLLKAKQGDAASSRNPLVGFQRAFERGFERLRNAYHALLTVLVHRRALFIPTFLMTCAAAFLLVPWLGQDFFPNTDNGQFILHLRAKSGTRIEETAKLCDLVEGSIRREIPEREVDNILDNIGLPYSAINFMHSTSGLIGAGDADILVSLKEDHHTTADYVQRLREKLPREYPGTTFYFLPSDIVTQVLNFGLPAPIDVQIEGTDVEGNREVAARMLHEIEQVPGIADARIQQAFDYPEFDVAVDRTKAAQGGYTQRDVANSLLNSLSGSFQITPMFFLNFKNGVSYNLVTQTPQYSIQSLEDLQNTPLNAAAAARPEILADVASIQRTNEMQVISHYNIRRVVDIYAAVQGRDLGAVGREVTRIVDANRKSLPRGSFITVRGQLQTMRSSYLGLLGGLVFSVILVYLLIVVNFQSWLDPFVIITALPAALAGIVGFLFLTHTTLSVPALMGAIMCMGVGTANSILVVSFAKELLLQHGDPVRAAIEAGFTRFRPVLMTALAMIIGMIPMALGLGEGGEQNAPLGRAVIGGLLLATIATLIFVPAVFSLLHRQRDPSVAQEHSESNPEPISA